LGRVDLQDLEPVFVLVFVVGFHAGVVYTCSGASDVLGDPGHADDVGVNRCVADVGWSVSGSRKSLVWVLVMPSVEPFSKVSPLDVAREVRTIRQEEAADVVADALSFANQFLADRAVAGAMIRAAADRAVKGTSLGTGGKRFLSWGGGL
jgi:hypothetical protein